MRHKKGWSQPALANELCTTQNQIYRLENAATSKPTISTLKKIAAIFDVGLIVRFVPFGEMIDYLSGTPRWDTGISTSRKHPVSFCEEFWPIENRLALTTAQLTFQSRQQRHTGEIPLTSNRAPILRDVARVTPNIRPDVNEKVIEIRKIA
jgi:transcriptional regulator with XRE-family HTH domain